MKNIISALFILLAMQNVFGQTGWFYQNPLPQAKDIISCTYANDNVIYAIAQGGVLLKSTNGGANFTTSSIINIKTNWTYYARSIYATDVNTLYALFMVYDYTAAYPYFIKKSTNGGQTWDSTYMPNSSQSAVGLDKINFVNQTTGYCYSSYPWKAGAYKTTNAGASWFKFTIPNTTALLHNVTFINENTGWVSTEPGSFITYKTTNGGNLWTAYNIGTAFFRPFFINANTGWIINDSVYKTTNGGINYTKIGTAYGGLYDYGFFDENKGWAIFYGQMFLTSNSGVTWNLITDVTNYSQLVTAKFINANTGITMGEHGIIAKTINSGNNWTRYFDSGLKPNFIENIYMADANSGWALCSNKIIKTTTGGNTWMKLDTGKIYYSLKFLNVNTGIAAGENYFTRTTDGGNTFTQYDYPNYSFRDISMPSASAWYIYGVYSNQPKLLKSTNSGANWFELSSPASVFSGYNFVDDNTGYCGGYDKIYKTTNGGITWNQISTQSTYGLYFLNASTGWNIFNGELLKTTDGGVNWQSKFFLQYSPVQNVFFINANTGWIALDQSQTSGTIFKTTDAGNTWSMNIDFAVGEMHGIYFINENTGWASGYGGTILKTTTGGNVFVQQISTAVPDNFSLSQNYPNPFNPNTVISYKLSVAGIVSLKIFDLLGKEVASLVNEKQIAGSYAIDFNSAEYNLPSGIYFYTLNAGDFKETRKMVLVK